MAADGQGGGGMADRVAGVLVGAAAGDALGAGYEFTHPGPDDVIDMVGGGPLGWAPGEWTDDTQMAVCVAEALVAARSEHRGPTARPTLTAVGERFLDWFASGPVDVGVQTAAVLRAAAGDPERLPEAAAGHVRANPRGAAGNGSLMRTAPVALAHLGDDEAIVEAAMAVSALTHGEELAGEACALWCVAIDRAVREQRLDGVDDGLALLYPDRRLFWWERLREARERPASTFTPNGFVVTALQAAVAAISQTPVPSDEPAHLARALETAVRIGHDTDTVAAIAGAVLGGRWGASAVPAAWRQRLHGWPGHRSDDLAALARRLVPPGWLECT